MNHNPETLLLLLSGLSAALLFVVSIILGMVGYFLKRLIERVENMDRRLTIIETTLKLDTDFSPKIMKTTIPPFTGLILLAITLTGCSTPPPPALLSEQLATNALGITVTNYVPNPALTGGAEAVGSLFGPQGTAGAAALSTGLALWAAWLNRKNKRFGVATVQAIESVRIGLRAAGHAGLDAEVRDILQKTHEEAGLGEMAEKIIDEYTGYTTTQLQPPVHATNQFPPMSP